MTFGSRTCSIVMKQQIRSNEPGAKSCSSNTPSRIHARRCVGAAAMAAADGSTPTNSVKPVARDAPAERRCLYRSRARIRASAGLSTQVAWRVRRRLPRRRPLRRCRSRQRGRRAPDLVGPAGRRRTPSRIWALHQFEVHVLRRLAGRVAELVQAGHIDVGSQERLCFARSGAADGAGALRTHRFLSTSQSASWPCRPEVAPSALRCGSVTP